MLSPQDPAAVPISSYALTAPDRGHPDVRPACRETASVAPRPLARPCMASAALSARIPPPPSQPRGAVLPPAASIARPRAATVLLSRSQHAQEPLASSVRSQRAFTICAISPPRQPEPTANPLSPPPNMSVAGTKPSRGFRIHSPGFYRSLKLRWRPESVARQPAVGQAEAPAPAGSRAADAGLRDEGRRPAVQVHAGVASALSALGGSCERTGRARFDVAEALMLRSRQNSLAYEYPPAFQVGGGAAAAYPWAGAAKPASRAASPWDSMLDLNESIEQQPAMDRPVSGPALTAQGAPDRSPDRHVLPYLLPSPTLPLSPLPTTYGAAIQQLPPDRLLTPPARAREAQAEAADRAEGKPLGPLDAVWESFQDEADITLSQGGHIAAILDDGPSFPDEDEDEEEEEEEDGDEPWEWGPQRATVGGSTTLRGLGIRAGYAIDDPRAWLPRDVTASSSPPPRRSLYMLAAASELSSAASMLDPQLVAAFPAPPPRPPRERVSSRQALGSDRPAVTASGAPPPPPPPLPPAPVAHQGDPLPHRPRPSALDIRPSFPTRPKEPALPPTTPLLPDRTLPPLHFHRPHPATHIIPQASFAHHLAMSKRSGKPPAPLDLVSAKGDAPPQRPPAGGRASLIELVRGPPLPPPSTPLPPRPEPHPHDPAPASGSVPFSAPPSASLRSSRVGLPMAGPPPSAPPHTAGKGSVQSARRGREASSHPRAPISPGSRPSHLPPRRPSTLGGRTASTPASPASTASDRGAWRSASASSSSTRATEGSSDCSLPPTPGTPFDGMVFEELPTIPGAAWNKALEGGSGDGEAEESAWVSYGMAV